MSKPTPSIRVNVDVTNPGQFFACCGLLELASRINRDTHAHFEGGCFVIDADVTAVLESFFRCDVTSQPPINQIDDEDAGESEEAETNNNAHRGRIFPMWLDKPFYLRLDWWTTKEAQNQKLKTWTAGQRVTDILLGYSKGKTKQRVPSLREHFESAVKQCPDDWLRTALPIKTPMSFSYDSRLSRNNALDQGHVAHSIMAFSPAVDVLTLIALQRFRPRMLETWTRNLYCTWKHPLPAEIAFVAALGLIPRVIDRCFEFPIKPRDAQGRYKLFGHAQPARSPHG